MTCFDPLLLLLCCVCDVSLAVMVNKNTTNLEMFTGNLAVLYFPGIQHSDVTLILQHIKSAIFTNISSCRCMPTVTERP